MASVTISRTGPVVHVALNRPEVRNAFNEEMIAELTRWAGTVRAGDVRVAVLRGEGRIFSAGADLAWMSKMVRYSEEENLRDARAAAGMFRALDSLPVPLVGRVQGAALGGGVGLAAVCDIVVAADDAVFGLTEAKLGILPAVISPFVLAKIGVSAARELFLTAARFSAARAREVGLVHAVTTAADLDTIVDAYVREILTSAPHAVAAAKALIAKVANQTPSEAADLTAATIARHRVSEEGQDGMWAFLEKKKPGWV